MVSRLVVQGAPDRPGSCVLRSLPRARSSKLGVTGYGVAEAADAAAHRTSLPLPGVRDVAVPGFDAVGAVVDRRFTELGATVIAVSTAHGALHDPGRGLRGVGARRARGRHRTPPPHTRSRPG
ncbi:hypothetical protein [Streptomyces sp. NPDC002855]|uniref:hypothetical protein n=1 Tax=Streptomyces sp. NPDC002855 TaxID=3154437 RepID=UPI00332F59DF